MQLSDVKNKYLCVNCILYTNNLNFADWTVVEPLKLRPKISKVGCNCYTVIESLDVNPSWTIRENRGNVSRRLFADKMLNKQGRNWENGLSSEEEERLTELFNTLDVNKDGRIDVKDLGEALDKLEVPQIPGQVQRFIDRGDYDRDGHIDFEDFVRYVTEHEKKLRLSFDSLDSKKDGKIDTEEIIVGFHRLGVHIDRAEADKLLKKMDKDKTLMIDWYEWRSYLLFHPSSDICDILHYWRHATIIDVGENYLVPDDFTEHELKSGMWWRHLVAGGTAGAVSRTCTAPLDRLKVLLQVHATRSNKLGIASGFRHMLQEGGPKSLWRGNGMNVLKIAPEAALKFMTYEYIKRFIKGDSKRDLNMGERFAAGSLAGAISQSAIYPMEVLKTRLALRRTGQYSSILDCAGKIYQREGIRSFYRGYIPNLIGIIPYAGIDLAVYETLKKCYMRQYNDGDPGIMVLLACGTLSSTCGQLASYPLALVRTKLQAKEVVAVQTHGGTATLSQPDTMLSLFKTIVNSEGLKGLYRGITPNFMKVAPAVSISYVVYEYVRKLLGVQMT